MVSFPRHANRTHIAVYNFVTRQFTSVNTFEKLFPQRFHKSSIIMVCAKMENSFVNDLPAVFL